MMSTQTKNQGAAYRQFSRFRYAQLKMLYSTMRQAQIIQKIIQEWSNLPIKQRNRWSNMNLQEINRTPMKMDQELKGRKQFKTTIDKKTQKKMKDQENEEMMDKQDKAQMLLNNKKALFQKEKKIQKQPLLARQSKYIEFYRAQFRMLTKEHPNWTMSQKSKIIMLKWRQVKMAMMANKGRLNQKPKRLMKLSGRMQFKMLKRPMGFSDAQIMSSWKRFPFETKKLWQNRLQMPKCMPIKVTKVVLPQPRQEMQKNQCLYQLMHSL